MKITELRIEEQGKGENLTKEDLPKLNSDEIDVGNIQSFPVEIIYGKYKFEVDENFVVTYIGEADGTIITYTTEPEGYTSQDTIQILIKVSNSKGIKTIQYPDGYVVSGNGTTTIGIDYKVDANGTYIFKVIDVEDKEVIKEVLIDQIDKLAPLDFTISYEKTENGIKVLGETQDAEPDDLNTKSGIEYYEYYLTYPGGEKNKFDNREIEITAGGTYQLYAIAYDKAGNRKTSNTIEIQIIKPAQISAGSSGGFTLEIDSEGNLWAWGYNLYGQLGNGTTSNKASPIQIKSGTKFGQVSAGFYHSLAIDSEGNLYGMGDAWYLGDERLLSSTPQKIN